MLTMAERKKKSAAAAQASKKKGRAKSSTPLKVSVEQERPLRAGMPAQDSIISETTFVSPKGNVYRILKTNEMDAYDEPLPPQKRRRSR
jgi:hypothetical protein